MRQTARITPWNTMETPQNRFFCDRSYQGKRAARNSAAGVTMSRSVHRDCWMQSLRPFESRTRLAFQRKGEMSQVLPWFLQLQSIPVPSIVQSPNWQINNNKFRILQPSSPPPKPLVWQLPHPSADWWPWDSNSACVPWQPGKLAPMAASIRHLVFISFHNILMTVVSQRSSVSLVAAT